MNTVFTRYSKPINHLLYVIMFTSLAFICVYWCPCSPPRWKDKALYILLLYRYVALPNEAEERRHQLEKEVKKEHMVDARQHGGIVMSTPAAPSRRTVPLLPHHGGVKKLGADEEHLLRALGPRGRALPEPRRRAARGVRRGGRRRWSTTATTSCARASSRRS